MSTLSMPFTFTIAHECCTGALYGFPAGAPEHSVFAQLLFLLDVARLTTQCELENGVVSIDQQTQRLALEFLVHSVGTGVVPMSEGAELRHRMHLHMQMLARRLRAIGQRFQSLGGDVAYLRAVWTEENMYNGDDAHPLFQGQVATRPVDKEFTLANVANGMSIFHYIEGLQTTKDARESDLHSASFLHRLWTDIVIVYGPLVGSVVDDLMRECPDTMDDFLLQYFELAKRPGVVAALTDAVGKSK